MNPVGHIITGVQKIILRSFIVILDSLIGILEAAEDTEPSSILLDSLMTES